MMRRKATEEECPGWDTDLGPQVKAVLEEKSVLVWRLPTEISQSRLGDRSTGSNACTIIALKVAEAMHIEKIHFSGHPDPMPFGPSLRSRSGIVENERAAAGSSRCPTPSILELEGLEGAFPGEWAGGEGGGGLGKVAPGAVAGGLGAVRVGAGRGPATKKRKNEDATPAMVNAIANSIIEGNQIYDSAMIEMRRGKDEVNFTIPDAIVACKNIFRELDYKTLKGDMKRLLVAQIKRAVGYWEREGGVLNTAHLFLLVIAHERTVLITFQPEEKVVGLVDSHSHGKDGGALFASASYGKIHDFSHWVVANIFPEAYTLSKQRQEQEFEISWVRCDFDTSRSSYQPFSTPPNAHRYATRSQGSVSPSSSSDENGGKKAKMSPPRRISSPLKVKKPRSPEKKGKVFAHPQSLQSTSWAGIKRRLRFEKTEETVREKEARKAEAPVAGVAMEAIRELRPRSPTKPCRLDK